MNTKNKIVSLTQLPFLLENLKKQGKKIVTTNGTFDILHVGHKQALEASRALGDILIVGVNSDSSVRQYKSELRPIISEEDRAEMLAGLQCVDYVTIFSETIPNNFLEIVKPDVHCKSGDYKADELKEGPTVIKNGGKIVIIPLVAGKSTTSIIEKIFKIYGKESI